MNFLPAGKICAVHHLGSQSLHAMQQDTAGYVARFALCHACTFMIMLQWQCIRTTARPEDCLSIAHEHPMLTFAWCCMHAVQLHVQGKWKTEAHVQRPCDVVVVALKRSLRTMPVSTAQAFAPFRLTTRSHGSPEASRRRA